MPTLHHENPLEKENLHTPHTLRKLHSTSSKRPKTAKVFQTKVTLGNDIRAKTPALNPSSKPRRALGDISNYQTTTTRKKGLGSTKSWKKSTPTPLKLRFQATPAPSPYEIERPAGGLVQEEEEQVQITDIRRKLRQKWSSDLSSDIVIDDPGFLESTLTPVEFDDTSLSAITLPETRAIEFEAPEPQDIEFREENEAFDEWELTLQDEEEARK